MAQHNLDNEFRNKLAQRKIQPSAHAWERLDAMLNESENAKVIPVRKLNWLYIAAGILAFILIATMFFTQHEKDNIRTEVATEEETFNDNHDNIPVNEALPMLEESGSQISEIQKGIVDPKQSKPLSRPIQVRTQEIAITSANNDEKIINQNQIDQELSEGKTAVSVDELLASATHHLNSSSQRPTLKVDASSLLSQVDGELELSFREKVISTVSKKYQKVKVAVAERNLDE